MAKNRKFTENEKDIYRVGYLNGQAAQSRIQAKPCKRQNNPTGLPDKTSKAAM